MTVNEYLWYLEWLKIDMWDKYERYIQAFDKATSPQSSLNASEDGLKHKSTENNREKLLTDSVIVARERYFKAADKHNEYKYQLCLNLKKLSSTHQLVLFSIYVAGIYKPMEKRRDGLSEMLCIKEHELPKVVWAAKKELKKVLREQGIEIEDKKNGKSKN